MGSGLDYYCGFACNKREKRIMRFSPVTYGD